MSKIAVSVVIVTYNSAAVVEECLSSLVSQAANDAEIIVVDNGSTDDTANIIKRCFPGLRLIRNTANLGACKARNQGIETSLGSWVLTLDCDVVLERDFVSVIHNFIRGLAADVGMAQPKILNTDKQTVYSCGIHLSKYFRRFYDIGRFQRDGTRFSRALPIFGTCSAAALYNRKMLEAVKESTGYFDERFFFLVEDVDISWRAQKRGWKAIYCPEAICYHSGNSSDLDKKLRQYLCWRNRYYSIVKNEGLIRYSIRLLPLLFYDLPRLLYFILTNSYIFKNPRQYLIYRDEFFSCPR